jgi:ACS family tartrate transporter-like MFS transporter
LQSQSAYVAAKQQHTTDFHGATPMSVERSTMPKVYWRLLPLTILVYFLCYLDRTNVGFAALTMNKDLGLDAATYGMAAGAGLFPV